MSNFVTYQIALIAANAALIDQINQLVIGSEATATSSEPAKVKTSVATAAEPATSTSKETSAPAAVDIKELKAAVTASKKANGEEFVNYALGKAGATIEAKLLATVKGIDASNYSKCIELLGDADLLEKFNANESDDDLDDDDLGDDDLDDTPEHLSEIDVEAVTTAVRAAVKSGKRTEMAELLKANGANGKISGLKDCDQKQLATILAGAA